MNKPAILIVACGMLVIASSLASDGGQKYLQSQQEYQYEAPTGHNAPTVHPHEGLDLVSYGENEHGHIWMVDRKNALKYQPCTECHQTSSARKKELDYHTNHPEIQLRHGNARSMDCSSCHEQGDVAQLKTQSGSVHFNQAPKSCYQCHSQQYKDWEHGAHGKRIGSWAEKRVIQNCTECHNPHQPGFEKRVPDPGPKLGR